MKSKIKALIVMLILMILSLSLSGCWNSRELNSLAFMVSMGFDKTDEGILLTMQVLNPRAIASQKAVDEPTVIVYTEEGKDTIEMIRRTITETSRKLNLTHLQTVVFGEEFAKEGISYALDFLMREHQIRSDIYFAVAKGTTANNVLNNLTKLDTNPSVKLYSSIKASDEIWAGTKAVKINSLVNAIISDGNNAVITGVEVQGNKTEDSIEDLREIACDPIRITDLAVFQEDQFVGWLNEDESKGYNYIMGLVTSTMGYVEDEKTGKVTFEVTGTKTERVATLIDGKLAITVNINVTQNIETASDIFDITKEENIRYLEKLIEEKLTGGVQQSIDKAQKELGSDIFGFGEVIHRTYPKLWSTLKDHWAQEFVDLPIDVTVNAKIIKTGEISNSFFLKDEK